MMRVIKIIAVMIWCSGFVHGRVAKNLLGTTIFRESVKMTVKKAPSSRPGRGGVAEKPAGDGAEKDLVYDLPLGALNLVHGAEFFTCVLQPLYQYGEYVELEKVEADDKSQAGDAGLESGPVGGAGGPAGVDEEKPSVEVGARDASVTVAPKFKHNFYNNGFIKEILKYQESNPLVLLIRALFWQLPGTQGLNDFRVTALALAKDKATKNINLKATLEEWAHVIAGVLATYELHERAQVAQPIPAQQLAYMGAKVISRVSGTYPSMKNAIVSFNTNVAMPKFGTLIWDCIEYSKKNDLGQDFILRILMGAVYSLVGDDPSLISHFYDKLKPLLQTKPFNLSEDQILLAEEDKVQAEANEQHAINLIRVILGSFTPLSYGTAQVFGEFFPDCLETTIRDIVCALLEQDDGSFASGLVRKDVQTFLEKFSTREAQYKPEARDEWAAIMSNVRKADGTPRFLYGEDKQYDLRGCCMNMLAALNYIFELEIPDFDSFTISLAVEDGVANKEFIEKVVPLINEKLKEKLPYGDDDRPIIELLPIYSDTANTIELEPILCFIETKKYSFTVKTMTYHAEVFTNSVEEVDWVRGVPSCKYLKSAILNSIGEIARFGIPSIINQFNNEVVLANSIEKLSILFSNINKNIVLEKMILARVSEQFRIEPSRGLSFLSACIANDFFVHIALNLITKRMKEEKSLADLHALFLALLQKKQVFVELRQAALLLVSSDDEKLKQNGLELFTKLVEKEKWFNEAISAARECAKSLNLSTIFKVVSLLKLLVKKQQGFDEATEVAQDLIKRGFSNEVFFLLKELIKHDKSLAEAIEVAGSFINSDKSDVRLRGVDLFKVLVKKGQGIDEAIDAAQKLFKGGYYNFAFNLFGTLVENNKAIDQAIEAATEKLVIKDLSDDTLRLRFLNLFKLLVKKDHLFSEALELAKIFVKNTSEKVRMQGLELFEALVEKEQYLGDVQTIIDSPFPEESSDFRDYRMKLLSVVARVQPGKNFESGSVYATEEKTPIAGGS